MPSADSVALLAALPRRQREALMARISSDGGIIPQGDIAVRFGISQSAVSQRIWGGIKTLRKRGIDVAPLMRRLNIT